MISLHTVLLLALMLPAVVAAQQPAAASRSEAAKQRAAQQQQPGTKAPVAASQPTSKAAPQPARVTPREEVSFLREIFQYAQASRRDPFVSMLTSTDLRPQIGDLKLVTIISTQGGGGSVAIMRDLVTKEQYRVRVGQTLGRMRVAQIQPRAVVFSIEEFGYNRQEVLTMDDSTKARTP